MKHTKLWRGLMTLAAVLLAVLLVAGPIADSRTSFLNARLGTNNYQMVQEGEQVGDGIYFASEFASLEELIQAKTDLAEQISAEGTVLLKNDGALPLASGTETVTLWGFNSAAPILGGMMGSSAVVAYDGHQMSYGIREALAAKGFTLNQKMMDFYDDPSMDQYRMQSNLFGMTMYGHALSVAFDATYEPASGYFVGEAPASLYSDELLKSADGTVAVVVFSRDSSEASDYEPGMTCTSPDDSFEQALALSKNERDVLELAKAHSTKVIVVLNTNNPIEIGELKNDDGVSAILWAGEPGVNGFLGVADVISGAAAPSGALVDTLATSSLSAPAMVNYGLFLYTNPELDTTAMNHDKDPYGDWYLVETEGIYVGYRYYETRYEDQILGRGNATAKEGAFAGSTWSYDNEVVYPFGYGMSYTTFTRTLDDVTFTVGGEGVAHITVTNTGSVAGKASAQLYVQAPYTEGGLEKSAIQLLAFEKTDVLQPGQSQQLTVTFDPAYIASYDENCVKADGTQGAWVLDQGDYYFATGNGAHEALNNVLALKTGSADNLITITDDETVDPAGAKVFTLDAQDVETYSVNVKNALQDMELDKLAGVDVEYFSRGDWSKGWTPVTDVTATPEMVESLCARAFAFTENGEGVTWGADNGLNLIDMIEFDEAGNATGVLDLSDPKWDELMDQVTLEEAMTFIQSGGDDFENVDSIAMQRTYAQDGPVGFAYDQVAGYGVKWTPAYASLPTYVSADDPNASTSMATMPTEPVVAATYNKDLARREGELFGEDGLWAYIHTILAPGMNLHRAAYCGRQHEYYSEDPMLTNLMGTAVCEGGDSKGLMMEPKHFAFNHQELNRTGVSTFGTEQGMREGDLRAFQGPMQSNAASGVMTAFNRVGTTYAGAHEGIQIQIARNEWGYTGWYVTDMIGTANYQNWRDTIFGGGNCVLTSGPATYQTCTVGTMEANRAAIEKDTAFQQKMKDSIKYYAYQIAQSAAMNGITAGTRLVYVRTWWQNALLGAQIAAGVLTVLFGALYVLGLKKKKN